MKNNLLLSACCFNFLAKLAKDDISFRTATGIENGKTIILETQDATGMII
jgi:hypothetical protein